MSLQGRLGAYPIQKPAAFEGNVRAAAGPAQIETAQCALKLVNTKIARCKAAERVDIKVLRFEEKLPLRFCVDASGYL